MRRLRLSRGWSVVAMSFFKRYEVASRPTFFCCFRNSSPAHCWAPRVRRFFGKRQVDGLFLTWIFYVNHVYIHSMKWMNRSQKQQAYLEIYIYPICSKFKDPTSRQTGIPCFRFSFGQIFSSWRPSGNTENTPSNESGESCCGNHRVHAKLPYLDRISDRQRLGFTTSWFFLLLKKTARRTEWFLVEMRNFGKNRSKRFL